MFVAGVVSPRPSRDVDVLMAGAKACSPAISVLPRDLDGVCVSVLRVDCERVFFSLRVDRDRVFRGQQTSGATM